MTLPDCRINAHRCGNLRLFCSTNLKGGRRSDGELLDDEEGLRLLDLLDERINGGGLPNQLKFDASQPQRLPVDRR